MPDQSLKKLYYSIGEVSELTGIEAHVLRYWETEFRELSPRKNRGGKRLYKPGDIDLLQRIKHLLYVERFTIEGARIKLKEKPDAEAEGKSAGNKETIAELRQGLRDIKSLLDS